ncbi:hypothetical protein B1F79_00140 [Coxiella-like endosymbiont of Rhipicephalus sanguineus]|nr:hypothetical protein [Coxiella-like endosymbiont of Rhipicephalus sanguineus]
MKFLLLRNKTKWILLFSLKNSVKTTLLSRSEFELISPHQKSLKTIKILKLLIGGFSRTLSLLIFLENIVLQKLSTKKPKVFGKCFLNHSKANADRMQFS